jgi:DNA-binding CsgD family transcriptional regulator
MRADTPVFVPFEANGHTLWLIASLLFGAGTLCLLALITGGRWVDSRAFSLACLILCAAGLLAAFLYVSAESTPAKLLLSCATGLFIGMGIFGLLLAWGLFFSRLSSVSVLLTVALALLIGSLLWSLIILFSNFVSACIALLALALIAAVPLIIFAGRYSTPAAHIPTRKLIGARWGAVFGMSFNLFTLGLTFWPSAAGLGSGGGGFKPLAYLFIFLVVFLVARKGLSGGSNTLDLFYRIALPIGAAVMLFSPFLGNLVSWETIPGLSSLPYIGVGLLHLVGLNTLFLLAGAPLPDKPGHAALPLRKDNETPPRLYACQPAQLLAGGFLPAIAAMALGIVVFRALGKDAQVVSLCVLSAFLALLVITTLYEAYSKPKITVESSGDPNHTLDAHCARFADTHGLSPRETEILTLLARGRGSKWIGDRLCISPETVRTHNKRIYEKLHVHTKEELLDLLDRVAKIP